MILNETEIRHLYRMLRHGDMSSRVHCQDPNTKKALASTLVKGEDAVVEFAKQWNTKGQVYISRNPMLEWNKPGKFTCLTFDIDPKYDKAKGATDVQVETAIKAGRRLLENYAGGTLALSGNGVLIVYPLPQDITNQLNGTLQPAYLRLNEEIKVQIEKEEPVNVDVLADDARLIRLVGTLNVKGDKENHRLSKFLYLPPANKTSCIQILTRLKELAAAPAPSVTVQKDTYEPWVEDLIENGLKPDQKHFGIVKLAGYFGGKRLPQAITRKLIIEANSKCTAGPASIEDVDFRINDIYQRISKGQYDAQTYEITAAAQTVISTPNQSSQTFLDELARRAQFKSPEIPWPFPEVNRITWGVPRGCVIIIGGWPGKGKTSMLTSSMVHANTMGKSVLYWTTEMSEYEIKSRYISTATGILGISLHNGRLTDEERQTFSDYYPKFLQQPFHISAQKRPNLREISLALEKYRPDVLVVDYLQRIASKTDNRRTEVGEFVMGIKDVAAHYNVGCIVASQFHRPQKNQQGMFIPPTQFDFAECGAIEQNADIAMLLYPPVNQKGLIDPAPSSERYQSVSCQIVKNRHVGITGLTYLRVDTLTSKFEQI